MSSAFSGTIAEAFRGYALAPLREAATGGARVEDALAEVAPDRLATALWFAIEWVSDQLSIKRARLERRLPMHELLHGIDVVAPHQQALALIQRRASAIPGTGVPRAPVPVIGDWLDRAAIEQPRIASCCRAIEAKLVAYVDAVGAAAATIGAITERRFRSAPFR